jgi:uncharacterized protein (TIGR02996 family)
MVNHSDFWSAIRANPEDDTHRLVYADWLEDQGQQERGEFIRVQCELARPDVPAPRRKQLLRREGSLLDNHSWEWFGPLRTRFQYCGIERGFVAQLTDWLPVFVQNSTDVERFAPVLHSAVVAVNDDSAGLFRLPLVGRVRSLLLDHVNKPSLKDLTQRELPPNISRLGVVTGGGDDLEMVLRFLKAPLVRSPEWLRLFFGGPQTWAAEQNARVLERIDLPNLKSFGLWGVGEQTGRLFAEWPGLARLQELYFNCSAVTDEGVATLLGSAFLPKVETIHLDENQLTDAAAISLAGCPRLNRLRLLDLAENSIGNRGAGALATSPWFPAGMKLDVSYNRIGPTALRKLKKRFGKQLIDDGQE